MSIIARSPSAGQTMQTTTSAIGLISANTTHFSAPPYPSTFNPFYKRFSFTKNLYLDLERILGARLNNIARAWCDREMNGALQILKNQVVVVDGDVSILQILETVVEGMGT
jgi:hypothetical protein